MDSYQKQMASVFLIPFFMPLLVQPSWLSQVIGTPRLANKWFGLSSDASPDLPKFSKIMVVTICPPYPFYLPSEWWMRWYHPWKVLIICELCIFQNLWFRVDGLWHPYILLKWILWQILWTVAIHITHLECWSIPGTCLISISYCFHLVVDDPAPPHSWWPSISRVIAREG